MEKLLTLGKKAKEASYILMNLGSNEKNRILQSIAHNLKQRQQEILKANALDIQTAQEKNTPANLIDRMELTEERLQQIISGVQQVVSLKDPTGEVLSATTLPNGLLVSKMRVALGVVGMIYEARPNVTVDAAALCLKSGNTVILRGSKDIIHSNMALVAIMRDAIAACGYNPDMVQLVEDTSRETATAFMKLNGYLDVLIPRGGAALIQSTVQNATVPVIETGTGNCHVYIDKDADLQKALDIVINAKTQRTSTCNTCESVLLHQEIVQQFGPVLIKKLLEHSVLIHGDEQVCSFHSEVVPAVEQDWYQEYLALELSMGVVEGLEDAIRHINLYGTHHSDCIVSENYSSVKKFLREVDSACVYANASTRFSDGFEFGLGAEIGISTQKLHARGPMGLEALTSVKYIILGEGQIRQ